MPASAAAVRSTNTVVVEVRQTWAIAGALSGQVSLDAVLPLSVAGDVHRWREVRLTERAGSNLLDEHPPGMLVGKPIVEPFEPVQVVADKRLLVDRLTQQRRPSTHAEPCSDGASRVQELPAYLAEPAPMRRATMTALLSEAISEAWGE